MEKTKTTRIETPITNQITKSIFYQKVSDNSTFTRDTLFNLANDLRAGREPLTHEEIFSMLKPTEVGRGCIIFSGGSHKDRSINVSYNTIHGALVLYFFHENTFIGETEVSDESIINLVSLNEYSKTNWDNFIKFVKNIFVDLVLSAIKNGKISAGEFLYNHHTEEQKGNTASPTPLVKRIEEALRLQVVSSASSLTTSMFNDIVKFFIFGTNNSTISKPMFPTQKRPFIGHIVLEGGHQQPRKIEIYHDRKLNGLFLKMSQNKVSISSVVIFSDEICGLYAPSYNLSYIWDSFIQLVIHSLSAEVVETIKRGKFDEDRFFDFSSHLFGSLRDVNSVIAQTLDGAVEDMAELVGMLADDKIDVDTDTKWRRVVRVIDGLKKGFNNSLD